MTKNLGFNIMELVEQSVPDNHLTEKGTDAKHAEGLNTPILKINTKTTEIPSEQKSAITQIDQKQVTRKSTEAKGMRQPGNVRQESRVSSVLSNLKNGGEAIESEMIFGIIDRVYAETPPSEDDKMISFRGNKTIDNFYTQLPGALKPHLKNKRIAKEKIMGLVLQVITNDESYRREILGGIILHLIENGN